jgi:hypothetical protein
MPGLDGALPTQDPGIEMGRGILRDDQRGIRTRATVTVTYRGQARKPDLATSPSHSGSDGSRERHAR